LREQAFFEVDKKDCPEVNAQEIEAQVFVGFNIGARVYMEERRGTSSLDRGSPRPRPTDFAMRAGVSGTTTVWERKKKA